MFLLHCIGSEKYWRAESEFVMGWRLRGDFRSSIKCLGEHIVHMGLDTVGLVGLDNIVHMGLDTEHCHL